MAHHTMLTNANKNSNKEFVTKNSTDPIFHDFLGMKVSDNSLVFPADPSASRGLISTSSDLGSDRQVGNHLEGVPFYSPRGDISTPEIHSRIIGSKRSISDTAFMGSYRDGVPHNVPSESHHNLHLMKTLRNGAGSERTRRSNDDEITLGIQPMRPNSGSLVFHPPMGGGSRIEANKWERSTLMNMGPAPSMQYSPRGGSFVPFLPQLPSNRFRDANAVPSNISQSAADEGSRTGIKGPGILSSSNPVSGTSERNSSILIPSCSIQKSATGTSIVEHDSSIPSSQRGLASASRQMTIFYGGQAHVFDDVHPNKADVIMALAGSNGGSWSTNYATKPTVRPVNENQIPSRELDPGMPSSTNTGFGKENCGKFIYGSSVPIASSIERSSSSAPAGAAQGSRGKDAREQVQAADSNMEKKRKL